MRSIQCEMKDKVYRAIYTMTRDSVKWTWKEERKGRRTAC